MNRFILILALAVLTIYQSVSANDKEECPVQIFEIYAPVCANNGKTYSNIYELKAANCDSDKAIKIASQGPCEPSAAEPSDDTTKIKKDGCPIIAIPTIFDPVCGDDGKTYNNLWLLKSANCDSPDKDIKLASEGDCASKPVNPEGDKKECPAICPANFAPVCGDNGKTYSNKCAMEVESCQSGKEIKLAFAGSCDDKPKATTEKPGCPITFCTFEYAPICGDDGKTYSNECGLKSANCLSEKEIIIASKGPCKSEQTDEATTPAAAAVVKTGCPVENCTREYFPVCGNDGETYTNECRLREANCKATGKEIAKASDGSCTQQSSGTKTK